MKNVRYNLDNSLRNNLSDRFNCLDDKLDIKLRTDLGAMMDSPFYDRFQTSLSVVVEDLIKNKLYERD